MPGGIIERGTPGLSLLLLLLLLLCCGGSRALVPAPLLDSGGGGGSGVVGSGDAIPPPPAWLVSQRVEFFFRRKQRSGGGSSGGGDFPLSDFNATYLSLQVIQELRTLARQLKLRDCSNAAASAAAPDSGGRAGLCVRFEVVYPTATEWTGLQVVAQLVRLSPKQPGPDDLRAFAGLALAGPRLSAAIGNLAHYLDVTAVWRGGDPYGIGGEIGGKFRDARSGTVVSVLRATLPAAAAAAAALALAALLVHRLRRGRSPLPVVWGWNLEQGQGAADSGAETEAKAEADACADLPSRPVRFRGNSDRIFVDTVEAAARFAASAYQPPPPPPTPQSCLGSPPPVFLSVPCLPPWWPQGFALATAEEVADPEELLNSAWNANCTVVCCLRPRCVWLQDSGVGGGGGVEGKFRLSTRRASCYPSHTQRDLSLACLDTNLTKRIALCSFTAAWDPAIGLPVSRANFVRFAEACAASLAAAPPSARALYAGPGPGLAAATLLPAFLAAAAEVRRSRCCDLLRLLTLLGRRCPAAGLGPGHYVYLLECLHLYAYMLRQGQLL